MPLARQLHAFGQHLAHIDADAAHRARLHHLPRLQHLLHRSQQAADVFQHDAIELLPLLVLDRARLQGLKVELDGGDWRLQFVGDRVDEAVVLLAAPDLADQEDGVERERGDQNAEQNDAEHDGGNRSPMKGPGNVERNRQADADGSQQNEGDSGVAAANLHANMSFQTQPRRFLSPRQLHMREGDKAILSGSPGQRGIGSSSMGCPVSPGSALASLDGKLQLACTSRSPHL